MEHLNNEIIYQIYPLTFNYASGSKSDPYKGAYGNLKGITAYADYVASLGVDAIWITPFYPWGSTGFGYDIIDYMAIDPMYGTQEDFAELCDTYHKRNIRVIIDQVYNHCSEEHPWFKKSVARVEPYTDYFVWADAKGIDENGEQIRMYDINSENGGLFINSLKELGQSYPSEKTLLAEYWYAKTPAGMEKAREIGKTSLCDAFFTGALNHKIKDFQASVTDDLTVYPYGEKLNWAFSNHDLERAASHIFGQNYTVKKMSMLMSLLTTFPESICIFQGEELGLPNPIDFSACKSSENDPLGIWEPFNYPWDASRAGFALSDSPDDSTRKMALHPDDMQYTMAVSNQSEDNSMLQKAKKYIKARKNGIFDCYGELVFLDKNGNEDVLAFIRTAKGHTAKMLCVYNFSTKDCSIAYKGNSYFVAAENMLHKRLY